MTVTLLAHDPCALCGYVRYGFYVSTMRINKRSMRSRGKSLSVLPGRCLECWWVSPWPVRLALRPEPASEAKIQAYRLRKWPELAAEPTQRAG